MTYKIADFTIEIILPEHLDYDDLLPSFVPFRYSHGVKETQLLCFDTTCDRLPIEEDRKLLDESANETGIVRVWAIRDGYLIEAMHESATSSHMMTADKGFHRIKAAINWSDRYASQILCAMLRIAFSQAILHHGGINIHASAIAYKEKGYLFLGKSGTGKSTHASLWLRHIENTELINDDNPAIRIKEEEIYTYGTPWSGKTPCYKNIRIPLGGIVRLQQAPHNRFRALDAMQAFIALMPGCAIIKQDKVLYNTLCDTLSTIVEKGHIGIMECLPDRDAAIVCCQALTNSNDFATSLH